MTDVLEIEAFDGDTQGKKILQIVNDSTRTSLANILNDNYERRVLISTSRTPYLLFKAKWDVIFTVNDNRDWIHILTYITHAPKSLCVVADDGVDVPEQVLKRIPAAAGVTMVCQRHFRPLATSFTAYDIILLPPISDHGSSDATTCLQILSVILGQGNQEMRRSWLKELRAAGAGIAWSRRAGVTWYDPADVAPTTLASHQNQAMLTSLVVAGQLRLLADLLGK